MSEGPEQPEQTASAEPEPAAPDGGVSAAAPTPAVQPAREPAASTPAACGPTGCTHGGSTKASSG